MRVEISDAVLAAIVAFVAMQRSFTPDNDSWIVNHYPALCDWLEGLGLLPPHASEEIDEETSQQLAVIDE